MNASVARSLALAALLVAPWLSSAEEPRLSLKGYDPVAYFTEGKPMKGAAEFRADWDGARYHFASARNRDTFAASPDRYAPQFKGLCTAGLSYNKQFEADPTVWKIVEGKLYVFGSPRTMEKQEKDPELIARAHRNYQAVKK